nr:hypothetical protein [Candidatus Njordarchaeota archaeon]
MNQREAPSSPRKVLATFILIMATIAPLVVVSTGSSAMNYTQPWTPAKNGTTETHIVCGLTSNTAYQFAIKAYDESSNLGGASNSPNATTATQGGGSGTAMISATIVAGVLAIVLLTALGYVIRRKFMTEFSPVKVWEVNRELQKPVEEESALSLNCDESLRRSPQGTVIRTEGIGATTPALPCMICSLEVKKSDEVAWCPYCGNIGHRDHLLEWLHTHNSCPMCQTRLNEKILKEQL